MTEEKYYKAANLLSEINEVKHDKNVLENYSGFAIYVSSNDGRPDYVCDIPDELLEIIQKWYHDKYIKLCEEFRNL